MHNLDLVADRLVFVNLDITCWSGKKALTPEDLGLDRDRLPPDTLVSLGDKQLIDPAALREFTSLRSAARRACLAVGTRFLGGYAVPEDRARALLDKLGELEQRYTTARSAFLANYRDRLAIWVARQPPQWRPLIRDALVPAEHVGGRLRFAVQAVCIQAPAPEVVDHPGLSHALAGLSGQVCHEVALLAREALEKSFRGRSEVTRRALSPFRAMRDKLDGLTFVDGRFEAVILEIDRLLAAIPAKPPITGVALERLRRFLCLAAQPDGLRTFAEHAAGTANAAFIGPTDTESEVNTGDAEPDRAIGIDAPPEPSCGDEPEQETADTASDEDWFF